MHRAEAATPRQCQRRPGLSSTPVVWERGCCRWWAEPQLLDSLDTQDSNLSGPWFPALLKEMRVIFKDINTFLGQEKTFATSSSLNSGGEQFRPVTRSLSGHGPVLCHATLWRENRLIWVLCVYKENGSGPVLFGHFC